MKKTFQYESFDIQYSDIGEGLPVILLHGFGEDSRIWNHQAEHLSSHCRLIIPDLPASGASLPLKQGNDSILKGLPASIDSLAEAIYALTKHENLASFILLGHSMGGYISLAIAEKYGDHLMGLGLIHSTAFADNEDKKNTRRKAIDFIQKNGGYNFLQTAIPGLFGQAFNEKQPNIVNSLIEQFNPANAKKDVVDAALIAYYSAMLNRPDRTIVLKSSKVPVLFIIGTEDKAVPMADTLQQVSLPETSYVHILQQTGHMGMLEAPALVNEHLMNFINNIKHST
ncbi:MAG: alpha/beta hydrolase [Bacteroidota bacterium]